MILMAMRPVVGVGKGREMTLGSDSQASWSVSAFKVVFRD